MQWSGEAWARLRWAARTWPFTLAFTATVTVIGVLSATVWRSRHAAIEAAVGTDLDAIVRLRLWRFVTAPFYQSDVGIGWSMVLFLLLFVGVLEYAVGTRKAVVTFFAADWIGSAAGTLLLALLGEAGWSYAHHAARVAASGSSVGMFASAGAAAALAPGRWRWLALGALYGFMVPSLAWFSFATWAQHLIGVTAAVALAALAWRRGRVRVPPLPLPGWRARDLPRVPV